MSETEVTVDKTLIQKLIDEESSEVTEKLDKWKNFQRVIFSGQTLESRRCSLDSENVDYLLVIKSNHAM